MFATLMVLLYYCSLMALTGFYLVNSFAAELPWARCFEDWENCFDSIGTGNISFVNASDLKSSSELYF
jgi:solute carrier family 6 amino acid transporter-like protein 5/7/9/14